MGIKRSIKGGIVRIGLATVPTYGALVGTDAIKTIIENPPIGQTAQYVSALAGATIFTAASVIAGTKLYHEAYKSFRGEQKEEK